MLVGNSERKLWLVEVSLYFLLVEVLLAEGLVLGIVNFLTDYRTHVSTLRETGVSGLSIHNATMPRIGAAFAIFVAPLTQHELTKPPAWKKRGLELFRSKRSLLA